jgi:Ca2+-binding RTX toxin-like protein
MGVLVCVLAPSAQAHPARRCLGQRAAISGTNTHLHARGHRRVIVGTRHRDVIVGTRHSDWIVGGGGPDLICGGAGHDFIFAGNASRFDRPTRLSGGPGDDYLEGGFAADDIYSGPGDDRIDAEFGDDRVWGGAGDDFIRAQNGDDRINAGSGSDHVDASTGEDLVHGGPGNDKISTGPDPDVAFGDQGDDLLFLIWGNDIGHGGPGDDSLHGGPGEDICFGDQAYDTATACEHPRSIEHRGAAASFQGARIRHAGNGRHRSRRDARSQRHVRPFATLPAVRRMEGFLDRLKRRKAIKAVAITRHQLHRRAALSHRAFQAVTRRYKERLRSRSRRKAVFKRSAERYRVRMISAAISHQIDRLRWTPATQR